MIRRSLSLLLWSSVVASCAPDSPDSARLGSTDDPVSPSPNDGGASDATLPPGPGPRPVPAGDAAVCERLAAVARPLIPRVLILADRSGSMTSTTSAPACPPCFQSRWAGSVTAVSNVTKELDDTIDFGLMLFPTTSPTAGEDPDCQAGDLSVPVSSSAAGAIATVLGKTAPKGATPTARALDAAKRILVDEPSTMPDFEWTPAYVLLVNDGEPTCEDRDAGVTEPEATYAALDRLSQAGVPTYVVGYGVGGLFGTSDTMTQMAVHGGTQSFYPAENQDELVTALSQIARRVVSCDFVLENDPPRGDEFIHVTLDGQDVKLGDEGFTRDERTIRLHGTPCETLRDGKQHALEIVVECEPVAVL